MAKSRKRGSAQHVADVKEKIEIQMRRAGRPTLPINARAPVSETLVEKKRKLEAKARQRKEWDKI